MAILRIVRLCSWASVAILSLWLGYQYLFAPNHASPSKAAIVRTAPSLPRVEYATTPWTMVSFFASWCAFCRADHPQLMTLAQQHRLIGIAWKDSPSKTQAFLKELGNPYAHILNDPSGMLGLSWRVTGVPTIFVVDRIGAIRYQHEGVLLEKHIAEIQKTLRNTR